MDIGQEKVSKPIVDTKTKSVTYSEAKSKAFQLFEKKESIDSVMKICERSRVTVIEYLCEYLKSNKIGFPNEYVSEDVLRKVESASRKVGIDRHLIQIF